MLKLAVVLLLIALFVNKCNGYWLAEQLKSSAKSPEEAGYYEGDMILSKEQRRNLKVGPRNGLIVDKYKWPKEDDKAVVSYYVDSEFCEYRVASPFNLLTEVNSLADSDKDKIRSALDDIEDETCVKFVENRDEPHVEVISDRGCYSSVGRRKDQSSQRLSLGPRCLHKGVIIHEFLHALGFFHMQSSFDRDDYIRVNFENIRSGMSHNFDKLSNEFISHYGTDYDLDSVMHYHPKSFSKNGENTIETIDPSDMDRIGQRDGMSRGDIERINKMYDC